MVTVKDTSTIVNWASLSGETNVCISPQRNITTFVFTLKNDEVQKIKKQLTDKNM